MDSVAAKVPTIASGELEAWNEAHQRLVAYLSGFQIGDYTHQSALLLEILEAAMEQHAQDPASCPVELTLNEAQRRIEAWFNDIFAEYHMPQGIIRHAGSVSLFTTDSYKRYGQIFLNKEIAKDLRKELTSSAVRTGPDLEISSMIPREFDYGPLETVKETLEKTGWGPVLRAFLLWAFIYVVVYFGWMTLLR
jgi:hypothetical protein